MDHVIFNTEMPAFFFMRGYFNSHLLILPAFVDIFQAQNALVQWAKLGTGGGKLAFFISALQAGQNALTKQILPQLHLQDVTETQVMSPAQLLSLFFCFVQS